ncbi:hypothetical protein BDV28DRAFT_152268 [Aspergillus coremiiformis]|uniref:Uncharacterized protein n=1 Tax=Aspergillus coremiiformis TaxID=138285 RepID=A0A5N6YUB1_9EURO|nr:hypothetical protein BDV28DRAFT_152268 [Aspergillus coremiiformis]
MAITGSCFSFYHRNTSPIYAAAKRGLVDFMCSISKRFLWESIRVNAICPARVRTDLNSEEVFGWVVEISDTTGYLRDPLERAENSTRNTMTATMLAPESDAVGISADRIGVVP